MRTLVDVLAGIAKRPVVPTGEAGDCDRCSVALPIGPDGRPIGHRCCECLDAKRVRISLPLGHPEFGKAVMCECVQSEPRPSYDPMANGVPRALANATLAGWQPNHHPARVAAQNYVAGSWPPARPFLLLHGRPGRGKSHLAAAIVRQAHELHGVHGAFVEVPALMDRLRATFSDDANEQQERVMGWLERLPLLVLDDIGKDSQTNFVAGRIFRVINHRYGQLLPTVVTCNPDEFAALDPAVKSRLGDATLGMVVHCDGEDHRRVERGAA